MAAAAILDYKNFKVLTVGTVKRVELRHCAKFRGTRSNRGRDMAPSPSSIFEITDFFIFRNGGRRHLKFLKLQIFNGRTRQGSRGSNCVTLPNFVEIACVAAEICEFFGFFPKMSVRHLGFVMRVLGLPRRAFGGLLLSLCKI